VQEEVSDFPLERLLASGGISVMEVDPEFAPPENPRCCDDGFGLRDLVRTRSTRSFMYLSIRSNDVPSGRLSSTGAGSGLQGASSLGRRAKRSQRSLPTRR